MSDPLVLSQGWAFNDDFWTPLAGLGGALRSGLGDSSQPVVGVGHSLGFAWLLEKSGLEFSALVSINGFSRFTAAEGYPGVAPRLLARMMAKFEGEPRGVAEDFLARCGWEGALPEPFDPQALKEGLTWLRDWDVRDALTRRKTPLLVLAGENDPIVPPAMTAAAFAHLPDVDLRWFPGGHLAPWEAPDWCRTQIEDFLGRLS